MLPALAKMSKVAPLAGSVDRNCMVSPYNKVPHVAPLAGSVDRNQKFARPPAPWSVAPLAGSVDRNEGFSYIYGAAIRRSPRGERG